MLAQNQPQHAALDANSHSPRKISIVVPAKNEEESLRALVEEIVEVGLPQQCDLELIFIDDGSTDRTSQIIEDLKTQHPFISSYTMNRSYGKSTAWSLGFSAASGDIIITMDADLQNDPRDILPMIQALDEGYDLVSGMRRRRADTMARKFQSRTANYIRRFFLRDNALDCGCGLKAFRRDCLRRVPMFNGMHRFMEALFQMHGFRFRHMLVNDRPRRFGTAKYGLHNRLLSPLMDMLGVYWLKRRAIRYAVKEKKS